MNLEKWQKILGNIKDNFDFQEEGSEHIDEDGGIDVQFIEFKGPLGLMRLEMVIRPVVLDKKTTYSNRIGSETKVDYIYSPDEKSYKLNIFRWDEGIDSWAEVDSKNFNF
jgi:hypothetical protein